MNQTEAINTLTEWVDRLLNAAIEWTPRVVIAVVILFVGFIIAKSLSAFFTRGLRKAAMDETLVRFLRNIGYMLMMAFVVIAALSQLGVNTTSLAAIFAAAGLAIGLALQGSLGNVASGVMLMGTRPFRVGDYVEVAGIGGSVVEIGVFATTLNTPDNKRLIVPNGQITSSTITNFSANDTRRMDMVFGVAYDDDLGKAREVFRRVVESHPDVLATPVAQVGVKELADSSINLIVRPWVNTADYWRVWYELTESIKDACDKEGLSIPFPQRDIHVHDLAKVA